MINMLTLFLIMIGLAVFSFITEKVYMEQIKKEEKVMRNGRGIFNVLGIALIGLLAISGHAFATPSSQIWNPSTDIQATGTWHLGIDNYFTLAWPQSGGIAAPTDVNLTYGLLTGVEMGVDSFSPSSTQLQFNAKYGVPENGNIPAYAIGFFNYGFDTLDGVKSADQDIVYGLISKMFGLGRLSAGYYSGNKYALTDEYGDAQNTGFIFTWDKSVTDKLWACIDYASGYSAYGMAFYGFSYNFSSNTSVLFGYGTYNNENAPGATKAPVVTTQLDINI